MYATRFVFGCILLGGLMQAQDPAPPAAAPTNAAPTGRNWTFNGFQISGMIDAYYNYNANNPSTNRNDLVFFNVYANRVDVNMAKIAVEYSPAPLGFRFDAGVGEGFQAFHSFDPNHDLRPFQQIL